MRAKIRTHQHPHHIRWRKADQDNLDSLPCGRC